MSKENILAIPSKDRIRDETLQLLSDAGIQLAIMGRKLTAAATLPEVGSFTLALLRPKDIVQMVAEGKIPLGIVGLDTVEEYRLSWRGTNSSRDDNEVQTLLRLGIAGCRLVLAVRQGSGIDSLEQLRGSTIATSYPGLTNRYFDDRAAMMDSRNWFEYSIKELNGSVEAAPALGMAAAISDLVETGTTLQDNNLKEIMTIFESEAVLITDILKRKGQNRFVDTVRDKIFATLLQRGNPDAIKRQQAYNIFIAYYR